MTPAEREAIYDAEIAPELARLAKRCEDVGMSFVAEVEWNPAEQGGGRTIALAEGSSFGVRLVELACRCMGNVDALITAILKHARKYGHNSLYVAMLEAKMTPREHIAFGEKISDANH